jgi:hypothetical protein
VHSRASNGCASGCAQDSDVGLREPHPQNDYIVVSMLTVRAPGRRGASESSFARGLVRNVRLAERKQFPPRNQVPDASLEDVQ